MDFNIVRIELFLGIIHFFIKNIAFRHFNDRFDDIHKVDDGIESLMTELDTLGKTLEDRFELEDQLIAKLHHAHADTIV